MQFVFENENETEKQVVEIKQILNYLYYYPYLKRLLISFFNKKRLISISSQELKELLDKIDKINYESNFEKVLESSLNNMAEFIYLGELQNKKVSRQFVELYLVDKGLSHLSVGLHEKYGANSFEKSEISELKNVILAYNSKDDSENDTPQYISENEESIDSFDSENMESSEVESSETEISSEEVVETENDETQDLASFVEDDENEIENNEDDEKKSFLESYIENTESDETEDSDTNNDEILENNNGETIIEDKEDIEPPELDEDSREDKEDVDELYELASEEEKLDSFVESTEPDFQRVEITEEDEDPFEENDTKKTNNESEFVEEDFNSNEDETEEGYIKQGASVVFKSDELLVEEKGDNVENETADESSGEFINKHELDDEWPTESSKNDDTDITLEENFEVVEDTELSEDENISNLEGGIPEVLENSVDESLELEDETENQQNLFTEKDLNEIDDLENENDTFEEQESIINTKHIDISILLEDKKITKIIEVVFDYDMQMQLRQFQNVII